MRTSSRSSAGAVALALIAMSSTALAQPRVDPGSAISLYDEGRRLFNAKQYDLACPKFEASLALNPEDIDTRGMLALCYERAGKLASAWAEFREVRVRAQRANRAEPVRVADDHINALAPRLAKLTIHLAPTPGVTVRKNGVEIPPDAFGSGLAVDAGTLSLSAEAAGYETWTGEVQIEDGDVKSIDVPALVRAPDADRVADRVIDAGPTTVISRPMLSTPRWGAVGLAGLGVVSLGIGAWAGLDARASRDDARALGCNDDLSMCPEVALGTANAAYSRGRLATGFFIGSGVLVGAAAAVWLLIPPPATGSLRVQPSIERTAVGLTVGGDL